MKHLKILTAFCLFFTQINAQLSHSVGLKARDNYSGLNYKMAFYGGNAFDITVHSNFKKNIALAALYNHYQSFGRGFRGASWYYGGGFHVANSKMGHQGQLDFGLDGVVGFEYVCNNIPISFSLDYLPGYSVDFGGGQMEYKKWSASVRYVIN